MRARPTLGLGVLLRAVGKSRRGHAAVELALVASPLFLFIFGTMEMGRTMWLQNALDYSVAEAARCASNNPTECSSASQTQSFAARQSGAGFAASVFSATSASCGNQVSASYPMALTIPYMNVSLTLTSQACYPV